MLRLTPAVTAATPFVLTLILLSALAHDSQQSQAAQQPEGPPPNGRSEQWRRDMAKIEGEILIGQPVEEVFDFVADSRNEPSFNPAMTGVELLTPLPLGRGTRFRARMGRAGTQMLVELTEFDRPHRLGSRTTSSMMQTSGALAFAADGDGTVMSWDWQVRPRGWMRMLGPLFGPLGGRRCGPGSNGRRCRPCRWST